jgi:TIR domain-containing protein
VRSNEQRMAHDVFISHAHKDRSIVQAICQKLEAARVKCWIAERDISAGQDWTEATRNAIGSSRLMLLVLSENANAAPHIEREIAHAFYIKRIIVSLRLTKTLPRRDFLFYLGNVHWFDAACPPAEQELEALTETISGLIGGKSVTDETELQQGATKLTAPIEFSDSWLGALQASHYRTLGILKGAAIAGTLIGTGWLLWFFVWRTKEDSLSEGSRYALSSLSEAKPSLLASGDPSISKPAYAYTRLGLWVANTSPTPSVQPTSQERPGATPVAQRGSATPSPLPDIEQNPPGETENPQAQDGVQPGQEEPRQTSHRRESHRAKAHTKSRNGKSHASEGSRFAKIKRGLNARWHHFVARVKEMEN